MQLVTIEDPATDEDPLGHGVTFESPVQYDPLGQVVHGLPLGP